MPLTRVYQPIELTLHKLVRLDDKASHHMARVLRAKVGDELILFNGQGGEYQAIVTHIDKKGVQAEIIAYISRDAEPPINIYLAQGLTRGEKMDFIVQKAVELGVKKITPLITERCNVRLDHSREKKRLQHWQSVVISACEQSGRNFLPEVEQPVDFNKWLPAIKADRSFVLSPHVNTRLPTAVLPDDASIVLLIGPEGGLSEAELKAAIHRGFIPLKLGPRILRTETASVAVISSIQCLYGDFS